MRLLLKKDTMWLEHKGATIDFGQFKPKKSNSDDPRVKNLTPEKYVGKLSDVLFVEINGYWQTLTTKELDKIFAIYESIFESIIEAPTQAERHVEMRDGITKLLDTYHDYDNVFKFMEGKEVISTDNVKESFDSTVHDKISRATTYIKEEYRGLAIITIILRAVAPIWNLTARMTTVANEKAGKVYYEMEMFSTLANTQLINSPPFRRLEEFVNAIWDKFENGKHKQEAKNSILSSVVAGLGTSDIPNYLLATSVVNKLAVREVNTFRDEGDLITHVYQRIDTEVKKLKDKFARLKPKMASRSGEDEDKTGYLESFRTREEVRRDVHMLVQHYFYDYRTAKRALDEDIPASLVKMCIDSFNRFKPQPIRPDQLIIVQWVMAKIVQHRSIPHIDRFAMIHAMAITQAALIHWHLRDIAVLMSSAPAAATHESILITTPFDTVTNDVRQRLAATYPYYRHSRATTSRRQMCPGLQALEAYTKMFADQEWVLSCSAKLSGELRQQSGKFKPAKSLKLELAELLIKINKRTA